MSSHQTYRNDHTCECGAVIQYEAPVSGGVAAGEGFSLEPVINLSLIHI